LTTISVKTGTQSSIITIGESWTDAVKHLPGKEVVIITDENIYRLYNNDFPDFPIIKIAAGESGKNLKIIEEIAGKMLDTGIGRGGFILAIGGGVVCDIAGFLASVYMRGIRFGFISTSLLSQVDASIGGKNAVNIGIAKNMIGTFNQPDFVICDPSMLHTLPDDEYLSGLAELIKMGLILDKNLVGDIEENYSGILSRDMVLMESLISRSVNLKAAIVSGDEKETGRRILLNFGHTFGHPIETLSMKKHGFAVASGMRIAAAISTRSGLLQPEDNERLANLLDRFNFTNDYQISSQKFEELIAMDKKKTGGKINFVVLESLGKAAVREFTLNELMEAYKSTVV
jgi:3-dehydroquinate synthase